MKLMSNLLTQYAKTTTVKPDKREATMYGIIIQQNNKLYVKIDGSEQITPVITTTETKPGERVAVTIKDHSAIVMGNVSDPSSSSSTSNGIKDQITNISADFANIKIVVADKVSTGELEATVAIINQAIIDKATIGDLEALNAYIKNLNVEELTAKVAVIDEAVIGKADIEDLKATIADIENLTAEFANIKTLVGGNLTMDNIQSLVLTASKVTVDNAFIKDAMIDRVSANKLTAGIVNTNLINLESQDGTMSINGALQQFKDNSGNVRIQIGKDATGDFTFALYGADGTGQLINQNGITASAIGNGIIVNDMISNTSPISGDKLDISSVVTEINEGTTSIKGSKIFLDNKNQSLDIAFNTLTTSVTELEKLPGEITTIKDTMETLNTDITLSQGKIETLISNTTIVKENGEVVQLKDDYSNFKVTVDGISSKVSSLETNYKKTLKSTKTQYCLSLSSTSIVGTEWSEETPVWTPGRYVWQRLVYVYSNDEEVIGKEVCIQGIQGAQGDPGNKGDKGEPGATGNAGQGVTSVTPQFTKHTSNTTLPADAVWVDTCPAYEKGKFLWVRNKVIYTNPNETRYTNPYYDTSWDAKGVADDAKDTVTSKVSEFQQSLDGFKQTVSETYVTNANMETAMNESTKELHDQLLNAQQQGDTELADKIQAELDQLTAGMVKQEEIDEINTKVTSFSQWSEGFKMEFDSFKEIANSEIDGVKTEIENTSKYIEFIDGAIILGEKSSQFKVKITNTNIDFMQGDVAVAYISNNKLYITEAEIANNMSIGKFQWIPRSNGNLSFTLK